MVALPVKARIVSRDDHEPRIDQALNDGFGGALRVRDVRWEVL